MEHGNKGKKQSAEHIAKRLKNQSFWKKRTYTLAHKQALKAQMLGNKINLGRVQSSEERRKRSQLQKGSNCYLWKGGVTPINDAIRKSADYKIWRDSVYKRDNWTCQKCHVYGVDVHADHIKPFALYPELRFAIDNGRTLCVPCHRKTDTWGYKTILLGRKLNITVV